MTLKDLQAGRTAVITKVGGNGAIRHHFLDMGLIPGTEITLVKFAPMGDPIEYRLHGYELTLRKDDAANIEVEECPAEGAPTSGKEQATEASESGTRKRTIPHPGLGEDGRFHDKEGEHPVAPDTLITFALAGNQNCGKTTLFNRLTGANQHVGNFPGVTVDRKDGSIRGKENTCITDLPGIYSLSPYSSEEIVTREFILKEKPMGIINIVDASNIERNLYLTMQLMELNIPMVVALNMMDEVRKNGGSIRINEMEALLGVPVVSISAAKNEGIQELVDHALHVAKYQECGEKVDFCSSDDARSAVHRAIHGIMHLIEDHARKAEIPLRFAASKLAEGDEQILEQLGLDDNEKEMLEHILCQMEKERGLDRVAAIADMRFHFISELCEKTVVKPKESVEHARSRKLDTFLTGRFTAIPAFIGIMLLVFYLTFEVIGKLLSGYLDAGIEWLVSLFDRGLTAIHVNPVLQALLIDGICSGIGSVLGFLPIIVTLFFFLSMLEDSGYMARVAFVMDKLLRKIGLSGRSIVPMLVGLGCTVPGVMASRTLSSQRDRKLTILLTPFMSCSAKLPIYVFFAGALFPEHQGLVMVALYALGIITGVLVAIILKNTWFRGEAVPFVMELPNYRMPGLKNVVRLLWDKAKDFLQRAFTVILIATIVIWFLQNFDYHFNMVKDASESLLAMVAGVVAPIFAPMGFGDWRFSTALITGFMAKESVVSTLNILLPAGTALHEVLTVPSAISMLVFCLLYTPCVAAIAAIRRELGRRWSLIVVVGQCVVAWLVAFLVYLLAGLLW